MLRSPRGRRGRRGGPCTPSGARSSRRTRSRRASPRTSASSRLRPTRSRGNHPAGLHPRRDRPASGRRRPRTARGPCSGPPGSPAGCSTGATQRPPHGKRDALACRASVKHPRAARRLPTCLADRQLVLAQCHHRRYRQRLLDRAPRLSAGVLGRSGEAATRLLADGASHVHSAFCGRRGRNHRPRAMARIRRHVLARVARAHLAPGHCNARPIGYSAALTRVRRARRRGPLPCARHCSRRAASRGAAARAHPPSGYPPSPRIARRSRLQVHAGRVAIAEQHVMKTQPDGLGLTKSTGPRFASEVNR